MYKSVIQYIQRLRETTERNEVLKMKKYYYINLAGVPFSKVYESEKELGVVPKFWKQISETEAKNYNVEVLNAN